MGRMERANRGKRKGLIERAEESAAPKGASLNRKLLVFLVVFLTTLAVLELGVALEIEAAQPWTRFAMWIGFLLWLLETRDAWRRHSRAKVSLAATMIVTVIMVVSAAGLYLKAFSTSAQWVNVLMVFILMKAACIRVSRSWNDSRYTYQPVR